MNTTASHDRKRHLSPSATAAIAAAVASAAASCLSFLLWSLLPVTPSTIVVIALPLIVAPFAVAAAAWLAGQGAVQTLLAPMVESVERLAGQDLSTPVVPATIETAELAAALEKCRTSLLQSQRGTKVHGAVARLLGAAVGRLAEGDLKTRITVDLPEPYRTFRDDFNRAMEQLEDAFAKTGDTVPRLAVHAREIHDAAEQLSRRAGKLVDRVGSDLELMETSAHRDPSEALRIAVHTLSGVRVAARRNQDAATHFISLGQRIAAEAARLSAMEETKLPETESASDTPRMPSATFPKTLGANVLKLHD